MFTWYLYPLLFSVPCRFSFMFLWLVFFPKFISVFYMFWIVIRLSNSFCFMHPYNYFDSGTNQKKQVMALPAEHLVLLENRGIPSRTTQGIFSTFCALLTNLTAPSLFYLTTESQQAVQGMPAQIFVDYVKSVPLSPFARLSRRSLRASSSSLMSPSS